ncbi:potassium channel family protein [Kitasatospora sp. NPDC006697]|uniref:potassium channel family protein n=1 Tax=Kitasatospora sp. NPDC006697 TaxID=3364020 RepID=UPI0036B4D2AD
MDSPRPSPLLAWLLLGVFPAALVVAFFTVPLGAFGPEHPQLSWTVFVLMLAVQAVALIRQIGLILRQSERGMPALVITAASFLALISFAAAYSALAHQPGEFNGLHTRLDALYFTVVTMATVGYGDITPTGQSARLVVMLQIGYTLVFLAAGFTALSQRVRGRISRHSEQREARTEHRQRHGDGPHEGGPDGRGPHG